jgi:hypothetical protein
MAMSEREQWDMIHAHRVPKPPLSERAAPVVLSYGVKVRDWQGKLLRWCPAWKLVAVAGAVSLGLVALFPPFRYTYRAPISLQIYAGHSPIFSPPDAQRDLLRPRYTQYRMEILPTTEVDLARLMLEWSGIALLAGGVSALLYRGGGGGAPQAPQSSMQ